MSKQVEGKNRNKSKMVNKTKGINGKKIESNTLRTDWISTTKFMTKTKYDGDG